MIESIVPVFKLLCFDFGKYACIIALSLFLSNVLAFLVEFTLTLSSKKEHSGVYFLCFSLVGIIISAYFSVQDYLGVKRLFISANYVYAFLTLYSVCALIFFSAIKKATAKRRNGEKKKEVIDTKDEEIMRASNAVKYFKREDITSEYLNVSYVKELINSLKEKDISESDYLELEEFEVYLLRFITRQPEAEERVELSKYISKLIKKLSLYA